MSARGVVNGLGMLSVFNPGESRAEQTESLACACWTLNRTVTLFVKRLDHASHVIDLTVIGLVRKVNFDSFNLETLLLRPSANLLFV